MFIHVKNFVTNYLGASLLELVTLGMQAEVFRRVFYGFATHHS